MRSLSPPIHLPARGCGALLSAAGHGHKQSTQNDGKRRTSQAEPSTIVSAATTTSRSLPLPTFIEMLRDKTGRRDVDVG